MNSVQIAQLINDVYEGVERSKLGSMWEKNEDDSLKLNKDGFPMLRNLPYNTYIALINSLAPKTMTADMKIKDNNG